VPLQGDDGKPHNQNILRGPTGHGMAGAECTTCHRSANPPDSYGAHTPPGSPKAWHMPPPEMRLVFVGVAPGALCEQIKDPARNGNKTMAELRSHLDDPFVLWAGRPASAARRSPRRAPSSSPRGIRGRAPGRPVLASGVAASGGCRTSH
jgi:hypothetical protein